MKSDQGMISLIVPAFNEEENLPVLVHRLLAVMKPYEAYEILIIDDGSSDQTRYVLRQLSKARPIRLFGSCHSGAISQHEIPNQKRAPILFTVDVEELDTAVEFGHAIPLFVFLCFEQRQPLWAAFLIILGFNIKIYCLVAAALFVLYPQKLRFLLYMVIWMVILGLLPLFFTPPAKLLGQYQLWVQQLLIKSDHDKWANTSIHRLNSPVCFAGCTYVSYYRPSGRGNCSLC